MFLQRGIKLLALQHGVEALNGGNADFTDIVQLVRLHVLDVVELGEEAVFLGCAEVLKLLESLAAQVAAVHEEEYALCASVLDESKDKIAGSVSLAATAGHLDKRSRTTLG